MFPDWSIDQLFQPDGEKNGHPIGGSQGRPLLKREMPGFLDLVDASLKSPDSPLPIWGSAAVETAPSSPVANSRPSPISAYGSDQLSSLTSQLGRRIIELSRMMRLTDVETRQIANLAGHVIELELTLNIDIGTSGEATVIYQHDILNLSDAPLSRMPREVWFKHTHAPISITPTQHNDRRVVIQRIHDAGPLAKFAFKISPPLQPGERTTVRYQCEGGLFSDELYWRQSMPRYTRRYTFTVRHQGIEKLSDCTALIEHPDGHETYITEGLLWDYDNEDVTMTLAVDYLRPAQVVELRWER
jgi:hypothetical protein